MLLPVLLAHLWLGEAVQRLRQGWSEAAAPMPARMVVAYVRELKVTPPVTPVARPAAPAAKPRLQAPPPSLNRQPVIAAAELAGELPTELVAEPLPSLPEAIEAPATMPELPPSTLLTYSLTGNYRGEVHGNAQVEWIRQEQHYQMHLDVSVGPSFAPLIARRMSSDGRLTPAGIAPQRYDEHTRVMFAQGRRATLLFAAGKVTMADGRIEPAPSGVQDAASQFVQLTWLFLTGRERLAVGHVIDLPLALPKRQYLWRYEVLGEEALQTPMGPLQTWHLKPSKAAGGGDLSAEIWIAPTLQYLPVRLRIRQDEQTYIDLMLNAPPKQAAPIVEPIKSKENS